MCFAVLDESSGLIGARHAKCHAISMYPKPLDVCNERAESRNACIVSHLQPCAGKSCWKTVQPSTSPSLVRLPSRNKAGSDGTNSVVVVSSQIEGSRNTEGLLTTLPSHRLLIITWGREMGVLQAGTVAVSLFEISMARIMPTGHSDTAALQQTHATSLAYIGAEGLGNKLHNMPTCVVYRPGLARRASGRPIRKLNGAVSRASLFLMQL